MIRQLGAGAVAAGASVMLPGLSKPYRNPDPLELKGNISHSVCRWTNGSLSL